MTSNSSSLLTLPFTDGEHETLPALAVQNNIGQAPDYSSKLYRLYLARNNLSLTLDSSALQLRTGQLLTLSPGESVQFDKRANLQSLAFHHNFFCIRVQRNEVYCDGVIFNRLAGLPIVTFPTSEQEIIKHRFQELTSILKSQGIYSQERALNAMRGMLLHAAEFKLLEPHKTEYKQSTTYRLSSLVLNFQHLVEETLAYPRKIRP